MAAPAILATGAEAATKIVYDGDCPFCAAYVGLASLRESVGPVELVDARKSPAWRNRLTAMGIDLNDGFVVEHEGRMMVGAEALSFIARASPRRSIWDQLNWRLFRRPAAARAVYPALRLARNATLRLLGRNPI